MTDEALPTRVGHRGNGDSRFFGHALLGELLGVESLSSLIALSVSGRRVTAEEHAVLDAVSVVAAVADPRIWPLKIARLVSSYGGTLAAVAAGQLYLEGDLIGHWSAGAAAATLVELGEAIAADSVEGAFERQAKVVIAKYERLVGYGGPLRPDDRLPALRGLLEAKKRTGLFYWHLQERFSEVVVRARGTEPNIVIGVAAALLDVGLSPQEVSRFGFFSQSTTFISNAVEGAAQAPAILRCLPTDSIDYIGAPPRLSARAERT